jgi:hypothetical protein
MRGWHRTLVPESPTSGHMATVAGGAGKKRFKPFQNSYSSKMFKIFQTLIDPKLTFLSSKNLK